jgi:CubicO group peptidase (beta-lactamase class C family)
MAALRREEPTSATVAAATVPSRPTPREITRPDSVGLSRAGERGARLPRLKSMIVSWKGEIALERYYHGATRTSPANIKSASKTVISALVGIAIARGEISSIDRTLSDLLPTETAALDSSKRAITSAVNEASWRQRIVCLLVWRKRSVPGRACRNWTTHMRSPVG